MDKPNDNLKPQQIFSPRSTRSGRVLLTPQHKQKKQNNKKSVETPPIEQTTDHVVNQTTEPVEQLEKNSLNPSIDEFLKSIHMGEYIELFESEKIDIAILVITLIF